MVNKSLPTPEIRSSNSVIGSFIFYQLGIVNKLCRKDKNKEKEAENGPNLKKRLSKRSDPFNEKTIIQRDKLNFLFFK